MSDGSNSCRVTPISKRIKKGNKQLRKREKDNDCKIIEFNEAGY